MLCLNVCSLEFFGVFVEWYNILGKVYWPFVDFRPVVRGCRLLLVHTVDGVWDILQGVRYVFIGV